MFGLFRLDYYEYQETSTEGWCLRNEKKLWKLSFSLFSTSWCGKQVNFQNSILRAPLKHFCIGRTGWIYWNVTSYKFGPPANKHVFITIPDWILTCWIVLSDKYENNRIIQTKLRKERWHSVKQAHGMGFFWSKF